ncbi:leucine--tRNA ligase [Patescibacteria group bacterium]|nr:leucine--tRNA ligase [Patescibacteria group bacterium]
MEKYNPRKIEKKWQKRWEELDVFRAFDRSKKPKFYVLVEFPYPSGEGLHVGHCRGYVAMDVLARKRRMQGFNVLFPMGWDAFGLPTENYAIKTGIHPAIATKKNTAVFKRQQKNLGLSFDWSREINTTDPFYYKWTQWIFVQLFKKGLTYKAKMPINWCPSCKIGLANEEVVDGKCERCGEKVVRKEKGQWMLKITKYAERLIQDLDKVDYPERVKISQKEWIGKSEGVEVEFKIQNQPSGESLTSFNPAKFKIPVFTTRTDTLFGCTYLVLAPEYPLIEELKDKITNYKQVKDYIEKSKKKIEKERTTEDKEKTGIKLRGVKAINPVNNREIPIFVADYVLMHYGTGAIMAVPAHDQRDFDFAKRYNLPIIEVIKPKNAKPRVLDRAYEGEGILIDSGRFTGMRSEDARGRMGQWLAKKDLAKKAVHYKLRDWIFSRQRYWGEPIPMVKCEKCGWQPVLEDDLPVKLPRVKEYKPTEKGESPLAKVKNWVNTKCPKCGDPGQRETDVMPNWAGSNWYYLRYCDPQNERKLADPKLLKHWMPVDWYNGGMEHVTLHLLYSRFIYKFLWDIKAVPKSIGSEPYKRRTSHGIVLGEGGIKMSKSKGNVINPEKVVKEHGADTMRVYEMFMGPFEQMIPWDTKGVKGVRRFLEKVWKLQYKVGQKLGDGPGLERLVHKTIKKVGEDIESLKYNTAVSALMVLTNKMGSYKEISLNYYSLLLILLCPFAPHITEELWYRAKIKGLCCNQEWLKYNPKLIKEKKVILVIQINGKIRGKIEVEAGISEKKAKELALIQEKIIKWTKGKKIKKTIFVPGKLINFVV